MTSPFFGDPSTFVFYVMAVAVTSLLGGWWPGILATLLSTFLAIYVLPVLENNLGAGIVSPQVSEQQTLVSFLLSWIFICWICQMTRSAALNARQATVERDATRADLDRLLDRLSDGFVAFGADGRVVHSNRAFQEIMSLDELALTNLTKSKIVSGSNLGNISVLNSALASDQNFTEDMELTDQIKWVHVRSFPDEDRISIFVQDVTNRKEIEHSKEHLLAQETKLRIDAENSSRLRDEFLAITSHELRTPLTTILGWSEIMRRKNTQPELRDGLAAIEDSTRIQVQLINDLLDMSRLMRGEMGLDLEIVEICEALNVVIRQCVPTANEKGINLEKISEVNELYISADAERITQIFSNLLSNAIKFSSQGGTIVVHCRREGDSKIVISVEDQGEGIESKSIEHIFERFRQVNSSTSRRFGGLGLGLAIAKDLVESHGGTILAESEGLGKGSKFKVTFPAAAMDSKLTEEVVSQDLASADLTGVSILLVDDDPGTRVIVAMLLTEAGASVKVAESGELALLSVSEAPPQVVVSDIGMPNMNGYELVGRLRELTEEMGESRPRFIALTAFVSPSERLKAIGAGFDNYLEKPVNSVKLRNMIRQLVDL